MNDYIGIRIAENARMRRQARARVTIMVVIGGLILQGYSGLGNQLRNAKR